jgi:hypothetical protein
MPRENALKTFQSNEITSNIFDQTIERVEKVGFGEITELPGKYPSLLWNYPPDETGIVTF